MNTLAPMTAATPELLALADKYEAGTARCVATGYEEYGEAFQRERKLIVDALRLAAKPADEGVSNEHLSIIVGVKNVLEFAIDLAWDAERQIPDSKPKRLRGILNNIRQGYLKPAVERLNAASPSTTGEPKR